MTPEEFEAKLTKIPPREIPAEWETSILSAAREHESRKRLNLALVIWNYLFRPHALAWGALAAVWVAVAFLNFSGPRGTELLASKKPHPEPDPRLVAAEFAAMRQRHLLMELWALEPVPMPRHRL